MRSGVRLTAADTLTIDLQLTLGSVEQTIQVTAETPLLQAQSAVVSSLVTNQQMVEMPLNGRTFTALLKLSPGAYTGSSANLANSPYSMRGDVNISVNGSSAQNNSYLVDGMVNRNLWLSTLIMVPTVDSIQEVRMLTSNYSAEYGAPPAQSPSCKPNQARINYTAALTNSCAIISLMPTASSTIAAASRGLRFSAMNSAARLAAPSGATARSSLAIIRAYDCGNRAA